MKTRSYFIALVAILLTPLAGPGRASAGAPQGVLTLWNKLGSQTEIEQSEAGPNGTVIWIEPAAIFARYGLDEFGRPKA